MLQAKVLETKIKPILEKAAFNAIMSTFADNIRSKEALNAADEIAKEFAKQFSETASPDLASSIDEYIKMADIDLTMCATPQTLTLAGACAAGPVTGTAMGPLVGKIIKGIS